MICCLFGVTVEVFQLLLFVFFQGGGGIRDFCLSRGVGNVYKRQDVLTLLAATEEMTGNYADRPIITMSMAKDGVISRFCGEVFGSALTFGAAGQTSAPGQIEVEKLRGVLEIFH